MNVSLADLDSHDPRAWRSGREWRYRCPAPECAGHRSRSLSVNATTGAFVCFRCGGKGVVREHWTHTPPPPPAPTLRRRTSFDIEPTLRERYETEAREQDDAWLAELDAIATELRACERYVWATVVTRLRAHMALLEHQP